MKTSFSALCITTALLGSSLAFAATPPAAPAVPATPAVAAVPAVTASAPAKAVTTPAKKVVKKHAAVKPAKKASAAM